MSGDGGARPRWLGAQCLTSAWRSVDSLALELQPASHAVVERAKSLMSQPGLAPRDAFHAAHALEAGCNLIASSDTDFDLVSGLKRVAP
jgi:predicted nucleic acid-binding protein